MLETSAETYWEVYEFLMREAELLDGHHEREWVELCTDDVVYRMPVRETRERGAGEGFNGQMYYFDETRGSLELRVRRLETEYAWAEDPPSRTRHFVTNIRVSSADAEEELAVRSNLLLYRSQGTELHQDLISAERRDVLRRSEEGLRLARREILLDHSVLTTHNLSIFL
ncbi:aromatic-ring-hydroxylating dioxygenase subunit beta [Rubrobacter aplysinae]|uniref:aromatic-ring-hydroxylating dioxygenase subunit beta n=1 Tax=Rubrobacter aplysinae TaxID=909625 RepID=UPI00064BD555|nr:aromatic-ring-hydroxylating dioxygenase subunit beta [Rubrobacter aplysinae]